MHEGNAFLSCIAHSIVFWWLNLAATVTSMCWQLLQLEEKQEFHDVRQKALQCKERLL
jgi:hypothetical protein